MDFYQKFKNKKTIIFIFLLLLLIILGINIFLLKKPAEMGTIRIENSIINVEMADTPREQYRGLSNRPSLCADCGLLFNFPDQKVRGFVMRDMMFPLDIIFISSGKIIKIAKNLLPEGHETKNIYSSEAKADKVLEVNAGFCEKNGIKIGDQVFYN